MKECDRRMVPWISIILLGEIRYYAKIGGDLHLPLDGYRLVD
jgi:hypothetical protein